MSLSKAGTNIKYYIFFFFQAEDGIRDTSVTGVQTCALPISSLFASVDRLGIERARLAHLPLAVFQAAEEAALVALMADARTLRLHLDEHGIAVAIGGDLLDREAMAGAFALEPQFAAGAAPEGGKTGFDGLAKGRFVHEADHEDASAGMILDDGGDEAV